MNKFQEKNVEEWIYYSHNKERNVYLKKISYK